MRVVVGCHNVMGASVPPPLACPLAPWPAACWRACARVPTTPLAAPRPRPRSPNHVPCTRPRASWARSGTAVHRQLPGIPATPWLDAATLPAPFAALRAIEAEYAAIKREVMQVTAAHPQPAAFLPWNPLKNDPTLTTNANWNPRECWDSVHLYFNNTWDEGSCGHLPATCALLKRHAAQLEPLFNRAAHARLAARAGGGSGGPGADSLDSLASQGYDEVPTLGVKLYRIWQVQQPCSFAQSRAFHVHVCVRARARVCACAHVCVRVCVCFAVPAPSAGPQCVSQWMQVRARPKQPKRKHPKSHP